MNSFLVFLCCSMLTVKGEYYILAPTTHSASPTDPPMTHPTLSAAIVETMPQTAVRYIPNPSSASEIPTCGSTQVIDGLRPAKVLAPGPAVSSLLQPTKSFPTDSGKNITKTQI